MRPNPLTPRLSGVDRVGGPSFGGKSNGTWNLARDDAADDAPVSTRPHPGRLLADWARIAIQARSECQIRVPLPCTRLRFTTGIRPSAPFQTVVGLGRVDGLNQMKPMASAALVKGAREALAGVARWLSAAVGKEIRKRCSASVSRPTGWRRSRGRRPAAVVLLQPS
jgi:hypothetical protein